MTSDQSLHRTVAACLVTALLLVSTTGGLLLAGTAPAAAATADCETTVKHLKYKTNQTAINKVANGSNVTSLKANTRVRVGTDNTFYRVHADNPNGYCVRFVIHVAEKAMPPADVPNNVTSNDGNYTATWRAQYNWNTSNSYTNITFTLPADASATFAPNKYPVVAISWASERVSQGQGLIGGLGDKLDGKDNVTKHTYTIDPDEKTRVTVPLRNPDTNEKIKEWKAMYTLNNGKTWRKVPTDTNAPVYYSKVGNGTAVQFTINDPDAKVKFYANPTMGQKASYQWKTYSGGIDILSDLIPGATAPPAPALPAGGG